MSNTAGNICRDKGLSCIYATVSGDCGNQFGCAHHNGWVCNDATKVCQHSKPDGECDLQECIHTKKPVEFTFAELSDACIPVIELLKKKKADPYLTVEISIEGIKVRRTEQFDPIQK